MEQYHVTGMTCAACSSHVEKAVKAVDGVSSTAEPGFPGRSMIVAPEILVRGLSVAGD